MYVLPSIFTAGNIAAGYYAISQAIQGSVNAPFHFDNAAKAIGFAVVFDGLDGSIARLTNTASDFGRELDSLADVITFGVAPAILAWLWGCHQIPDAWQPDMRRKLIQIGAMVTFLFLIAGASRLARFNISKNPQPKNPGRPGRKYFVGMPIPAGAAMVAATVHFGDGSPVELWWQAVLWLVFVLLISYMMVSTWRFWSLKGIDFRSRQPFWLFIPICVAILLVWFFSEYFLFSIALLYLASGMLARFAYALKRRPPNPPTYQPESRVDMA
ncbi:MAG: CDP-diacylglycerol--serine O-phosphatidyltransferase [Acidobacteria bacterium]|nr:CDP-diacylglycerol--serine O-phosphatidyltransferase [Acidobacteriota bacterium]MBV9434427.1 CDP-diacylglycerol--serine O-phosphatidyltransferase [Acidobacteriota bacterium]